MFELDVLQHSPHDARSGCGGAPLPLPAPDDSLIERSWVPSRFNARTHSEDGHLILWNSYSGTICAFPPEQAATVVRALSQQGFSSRRVGLVRYLHENGFIVPSGTDEFKRLDYEVGRQHYRTDMLELILLPSEDCNFRCGYCYEDFKRGTMRPEVREGVRRLIDARAARIQVLKLEWFGGEPLYGFQAIEDIAPYAQQVAREHGIVYASSMTTNGYLLTPERATKLLAWGVRSFQITLDGPAEYHDVSRPGRDGSGTFDTIYRNLQAMREQEDPFHIKIRSNFDRTNQAAYGPFLEQLREDFAGDDRFTVGFHAVGKWGGDNDADLATCGVAESRAVMMKLRTLSQEYGLRIADAYPIQGGIGRQVCYAGRPYNFIIGADGQVMKCTVALDSKAHNVVGRLTPEGVLDLDGEKMGVWTEPNWMTDSTCRTCQMVPTCQGLHCPLVKIENDGARRGCISARKNLNNALRETMKLKQAKVGWVALTPEATA